MVYKGYRTFADRATMLTKINDKQTIKCVAVMVACRWIKANLVSQKEKKILGRCSKESK